MNELGWGITTVWCSNAQVGGAIDVEFRAFIIARMGTIEKIRLQGTRIPAEGHHQYEAYQNLGEILDAQTTEAKLHTIQEWEGPNYQRIT